jgi:hypothetical protein
MVEHERRRLVGARHGVVHEAAAQHLTVRVVNHFLAKRATKALHHAARDLRVREQRVDDAPAIVDDDELLDRDDAGVTIDLDDCRIRGTCIGDRRGARLTSPRSVLPPRSFARPPASHPAQPFCRAEASTTSIPRGSMPRARKPG